MPEHVDVHYRQIEGQLLGRQQRGHADRLQEVARYDRDQVGIGHHPAHRVKLVDRQCDASGAAQIGQRVVGRTVRPPGKADQRVQRLAVAVHGQLAICQRMVLAHDADVFAAVEALVPDRRGRALFPAQLRNDAGKGTDRQLDFTLQQHRPRVARGKRDHAQVDQWCLGLDAAYERRQQQRCGGIGHRQPKRGLQCRDVEIARCQQCFEVGQRDPDAGPEFFRARRRLDAMRGAHEQVVVECLAQALQGVRHSGLRGRKAVGSARQVLLRHDDVEDAQQVEIESQE